MGNGLMLPTCGEGLGLLGIRLNQQQPAEAHCKIIPCRQLPSNRGIVMRKCGRLVKVRCESRVNLVKLANSLISSGVRSEGPVAAPSKRLEVQVRNGKQ